MVQLRFLTSVFSGYYWGNHKYAELKNKMVTDIKKLGEYDALMRDHLRNRIEQNGAMLQKTVQAINKLNENHFIKILADDIIK